MMYFMFFDIDDSLQFGSANDVIDDFGQIELMGIKEMYSASSFGVRLYTDSDRDWIAEKPLERSDEPPLLFDSMQECVTHSFKVIVDKMYDHNDLLMTIFEEDIKAWPKLVRYI